MKSKTSKPMSLADFISGAGCVTLFEELRGPCIAKITDTNIAQQYVSSGKKGKKQSNPTKRQCDESVGGTSDTMATSDSAGEGRPEDVNDAPPPAKKKRKKRATHTPVAGDASTKPVPAVVSDPAEVIAASGTDISNWEVLHVPPPLLAGLADLGFEMPTEIQRRCLPAAIRGRMDLVGAAETGSGKTLAFALPVLYGIMKVQERQMKLVATKDAEDLATDTEEHETPGPKALVLAPTRELAIQVKNHIVAVAKYTGIKVMTVVGGMSEQKQQRLLAKTPDVIVATPGRLWEFVEAGDPFISNLSHLRFLVVDETDRMLEKGHFQQLHLLLERINADEERSKQRQNFVFSATLTMGDAGPTARDVKKLKTLGPEQKLKHITAMIGIRPNNKKVVDLTRKAGTAAGLTEMAVSCSIPEKDELLYYFCLQHPGRTLVFCNSIDCVTRLGRLFTLLEMSPLLLHARMQQRQRLRNLQRFQTAPAALLLATDVAARGLDVPGVQHVIHYQVPRTADAYVHRSGRTARGHAEGLSVMLVEPGETSAYRKLLRQLCREADLPPFEVDSDVLRPLSVHVRLARDVNLAEHRQRRDAGVRNWHVKAAQQMDIEIDPDLIPERDEEADRRASNEIRARRLQLREMLSTRSDVWEPRTQHGTLRVRRRNVSALEVAKRSKKKNKSNEKDSEEHPETTVDGGSETVSTAVEPRVATVAPPPPDCGRQPKHSKKQKLAAGAPSMENGEKSKHRRNAKQRKQKKWFARKGHGVS